MWKKHVIENISRVLASLEICDSDGSVIDPDRAFDIWVNKTVITRMKKKTVYLIGNGASASMASHAAADLLKNANIKTMVFTDLSLMTAISNDISYKDVFAEPLKRFASTDDMLVAISSSGRSQNIIEATRTMKAYKVFTITLSAMDFENPLRKSGDLNFYIPAMTYGLAETGHAAIIHYWIDKVLEK